ncbi:hypothetical protein FQR65_LT13262 [Abscondita terminalis]|nr:hypothetical protein FQR65_LT13262 [Abscondita terminalis]
MNYWKDKKVKHEKPFPIFGNLLPLFLRKRSNTEEIVDLYKKYENERYVGIYSFGAPALFLRDPELIKKIFVKEFDIFPEHRQFIPEGVDPLWSKNLFAMKAGKNWHDLRATLSPSFTNSKMKMMFGLMRDCSEQFSKHFSKRGELIEVELKDTFARFANDVIATTALGVTCDSFSNPNNEFYVLVKEMSEVDGITGMLFLLNFFAPTLAKFIKIPMFGKKIRTFFTSLVKDTIKLRTEKNVVRPDMIHLLMQAQKGQLENEETSPKTSFNEIQITDEVITAQVLMFFFAGFDTVSTMMSYACYELAINPEVQDKLREEVDETLENLNGQFTYDSIISMKYLDMVMSETLRKWPPFVIADRHSVQPYTIQPERPGEIALHLEKGSLINCPIHAIHMDPKYHPNPNKFDPERFSDENKNKIDPYTYFPFGLGPRNCIGSRFALLEGKLVVAEIISKFEIVPILKTQIPIVLSKVNLNPLPDGGIWLKLSRFNRMLIIIVVCVLIALIYNYVIKPMNYWKEKNVKHEKPVPLFGNMLPILRRQRSTTDDFALIYNKYKNDRYVGIYKFQTPILLVRDPELIKKIYIKDFDTFPEHRPFLPEEVDPLWSNNLFAIRGGEKWHALRTTLSPSFTSSKMKIMFGLMRDCSQQFTKYFSNRGDLVEVELKDTFARFANDVIASTAFGVTCNSLSNRDNEFFGYAKELSNFSGIRGLMILINFFAPTLAKYTNVPMVSKKIGDFFMTLVRNTIKLRKEKGIVRPDMLHLLMEAQKGQLRYDENDTTPELGFAVAKETENGKRKKINIQITDEIITSQVLVFFFGGFDSVSTMMSYACYELAVNTEIQDKLREEIDESLKNTNGEFTYESIANMKYLDMVISESLRKWPPFFVFDRKAAKPYKIPAKHEDESDLMLEKNSVVLFPIFAIHRDPKYFPDPENFDPERFSEQNKIKIVPYSYIPFGAGPRNCVSSRFALVEGKLAVFEIVRNFEIVSTEKTKNPIVFDKNNFLPVPKDGIWVGLIRRKYD